MDFGAVIFGAAAGVAVTFSAQALKRRLDKSMNEPPPLEKTETAAPLAAPAPPVEPELGNVLREPTEWDDPRDILPPAYFPDRPASDTRFEDLNRRLVVIDIDNASSAPERLPPRAFSDFPTPLRSPDGAWRDLVRQELRPSYPTIIDWGGLFAQTSQRLEREPYFTDWLTTAYLAIPENVRPVIVSLRNSSRGAGVLTFMRFGFRDYDFPIHFLNISPQASFSRVLELFTGDRTGWLWFSPARLRKHMTDHARREEEVRLAFSKVDAALTARSKLVEVLQSNDFSALWNLRDARLAAPRDADTPTDHASDTPIAAEGAR